MVKNKKTAELHKRTDIETLLNPRIRLEIFLILLIYPELNISQIAKILGKSKATVSHHCKAMNTQNLLLFREIETKGQFNPQYYKLNRKKLDEINPFISINPNLPLDPMKRMNYYQETFRSIKSLIYLVKHSFNLMEELVGLMERQIFDKPFNQFIIDRADDLILKYMVPAQKVDFQGILLSEHALSEFNAVYSSFLKRIRQIEDEDAKQNNQKTLLYFNTIIPLKDLLESNFDKDDIK